MLGVDVVEGARSRQAFAALIKQCRVIAVAVILRPANRSEHHLPRCPGDHTRQGAQSSGYCAYFDALYCRSSAEAEHTKSRNRPETLGIADFVRLCGVCLRALTGWESCSGVTRGGRQRREEGSAPVETACLREIEYFPTPPGRDRTRRVPTGFRSSPDQISRKHWGFGLKIVRVCPSSAELRYWALSESSSGRTSSASSSRCASRVGRGTRPIPPGWRHGQTRANPAIVGRRLQPPAHA
jgi:hypothetical protein